MKLKLNNKECSCTPDQTTGWITVAHCNICGLEVKNARTRQQLYKRNYDAVVSRGLITPETDDIDFIEKLKEEYEEVHESMAEEFTWKTQAYFDHTAEEIGDCIVVCLNWLIHRGVDPDDILTKIAKKNERRAK